MRAKVHDGGASPGKGELGDPVGGRWLLRSAHLPYQHLLQAEQTGPSSALGNTDHAGTEQAPKCCSHAAFPRDGNGS